MIMVDELRHYPASTIRCFRKDGACHLTSDTNVDELHVFARSIGLKRAWFQDHPTCPHYDLTGPRRERALAAGAVFVPAKE